MPRKPVNTEAGSRKAMPVQFVISDDDWYRLHVVADRGARRIGEFFSRAIHARSRSKIRTSERARH
jgi:hypothetical protein